MVPLHQSESALDQLQRLPVAFVPLQMQKSPLGQSDQAVTPISSTATTDAGMGPAGAVTVAPSDGAACATPVNPAMSIEMTPSTTATLRMALTKPPTVRWVFGVVVTSGATAPLCRTSLTRVPCDLPRVLPSIKRPRSRPCRQIPRPGRNSLDSGRELHQD